MLYEDFFLKDSVVRRQLIPTWVEKILIGQRVLEDVFGHHPRRALSCHAQKTVINIIGGEVMLQLDVLEKRNN